MTNIILFIFIHSPITKFSCYKYSLLYLSCIQNKHIIAALKVAISQPMFPIISHLSLEKHSSKFTPTNLTPKIPYLCSLIFTYKIMNQFKSSNQISFSKGILSIMKRIQFRMEILIICEVPQCLIKRYIFIKQLTFHTILVIWHLLVSASISLHALQINAKRN